jgi:hypothetical protein
MWYIDEQTGIWKEEGVAVKNGNNYIGEVKHFSFWNCDIAIPAVTLSLTLKTAKAAPLVHAFVRLTLASPDSSSQAYGYTDSLGQVSGLVPANRPIVLEVLDPCHNVAYSQNIGSLSKNTDLGTITINDSNSPAFVTIEGQLKDCSNLSVSNGYAIVRCDNVSRYVSVNDKGEFTVSFLRCQGGSATCEILGVDEANQQQGAVVSVTITSPITDAAVINACGTSSAQYINYNLDGVDHSIATAVGDSLTSYTYASQTTPPLFTWISGIKITGHKYLSLSFGHDAATGTYPISAISGQGYDSVMLVQPSAVTLTNYPANAGEFYEGTFTGKFKKDAALPAHTITGSFRIRRL